jgi:hypothetical protein
MRYEGEDQYWKREYEILEQRRILAETAGRLHGRLPALKSKCGGA